MNAALSISVEKILTDRFGRFHNYLRISITERCNLRCTYCMPAEGIELSPASHIMTAEEIFQIAKTFVGLGVNKIRITGGEPLVRKDIEEILRKLSTLPVELTITTNGVLLQRYVKLLKEVGLKQINVSLDSLQESDFEKITRKGYFREVIENIKKLSEEGFFQLKVNCVLMKGVNEEEIVPFVELSEKYPISVRFIEFMPFDGNSWQLNKIISFKEIIASVTKYYGAEGFTKVKDSENDTTKHYKVIGSKGNFGVISTVTEPFCDSCNRLRLTANGKIKNCLFSTGEVDLLTAIRAGKEIDPLIESALYSKHKMRGGMVEQESFTSETLRTKNRSMITIGG